MFNFDLNIILYTYSIMEIKSHPKYENYEISSDGLYRKKNTQQWLQGTRIGKYIQFNLGRHHKTAQMCVAQTFLGDVEDMTVEHINGNVVDNRVANLRLVENKEEVKAKDYSKLNEIGKTAKQNYRTIKRTNLKTNEVHYFKNKSQCAKLTGCSAGIVCLCCQKKCKHFANTFTFEYCDDDENVEIEVVPKTKRTQKKKEEE